MEAMQKAYEARISALEGELKGVKAQQAKQAHVAQTQNSVDRLMGQATTITFADPAAPATGGDLKAPPPDLKGQFVRTTSNLSIGGYTEFSYDDRGETNSQFNQRRTTLIFNAQVHDRVRFYAEYEWENAGVLEAGADDGDGEWELEQAYVDFLFNDKINFRAGQILAPLGRYNLYHEGYANNFVDRPLPDLFVIPTTIYEEGVGLYGQALDSDKLGISYEAYVFNPARANEANPEVGFREIRNEGNAPIYDRQKAFSGRVAFEPARSAKWFADSLEIGVSTYISGYPGFKDFTTGVKHSNGTLRISAVDFAYEKCGWGLKAEGSIAHAGYGRDEDNRKQDAAGFWVEGSYKFWPKFLTKSSFGRDFKDPKLILAARFEYLDVDKDVFDQRDMRRTSFELAYKPTDRVAVKFDYQMDHSLSSAPGFGLEGLGKGKNTDAFIFGLSVGF